MTVVSIQKAFGDDQMSVTSLRRCVLLRLLPMLFDENMSCLYRTYEVIISNKTVLMFVLLLTGLHKKLWTDLCDFYRAMHYVAKLSLAIACRLSVCLSVTLVDHDDIG